MESRQDEVDYYDNTDFSAELAAEGQVHRGTDGPTTDPMQSFAVRLPASVLREVRAIARERNVSTGAVLRSMVEESLARRATDEGVVPVKSLLALVAQAQREVAG